MLTLLYPNPNDFSALKKNLKKGSFMAQKVTAGHDRVGSFAPLFAELNDDFLFEKIWGGDSKRITLRVSQIRLAKLVLRGYNLFTSLNF